MFQAIASVFSKVLDYDITQCVQQLNEQSKTHEMSQTENGHLENGKLQEDKCGHITDQEVRITVCARSFHYFLSWKWGVGLFK